MIDFKNIEKYRENNRIEAKKAVGGLPHSIWETYSAFANTLGGIILLGVEEHTDKSLHPVTLPDPQRLIKDFWDNVNNDKQISANILSDKDVTLEDVDGKQIVAIRVPRAQRTDKPVYISGNPLTGSYRRNGEGDYRCTKEEVQAMLRDAAQKSQDLTVLDHFALDAIDYDSVRRYRIRMKSYRPGHVWEELEDTAFLYKLGAVGRGDDGKIHPTAAGLLMFGYEYEIVREFPAYFLDYREQLDPQTRWTDRIVSSSGEWSGNLYDFYFRVYTRLTQQIRVPFKLDGGDRIDDTPIHKALREALANCIINADYYGRQGLVIVRDSDTVTFSNPGGFRIDIEAAKSGGISDPRNSTLIKMFNLIDVGERAGSGIPHIFHIWQKQGWPAPVINEQFEPDRITLILQIPISDENMSPIAADISGKSAAKISDNDKSAIKISDKSPSVTAAHRQAIIIYLTENVSGNTAAMASMLGLKPPRTRQLLADMVRDGILTAEGSNKNRIYRLKS